MGWSQRRPILSESALNDILEPAMDTVESETAEESGVSAEAILAAIAKGATLGDLVGVDAAAREELYRVGYAHYQQARYNEALRIFGYIAVHDHLNPRYIKAYASSLQMTGDCGSAASLYSLLSMLDLNDPRPRFHLCECLVALGMHDDATEGLRLLEQECVPDEFKLLDRVRATLSMLESRERERKNV